MLIPKEPLHLFEGYGIEMEYMLVSNIDLSVSPMADKLLSTVAQQEDEEISEFEHGDIAWSNELVAHVIEFKTNGPVASLNGLSDRFQHNIDLANQVLTQFNAGLLSTGAHPWMDPEKEMQLWPYGYHDIYNVYHEIFDCRGHGWSNLQSTHLNLPFANDAEFALLHTAIRFLLPLMPALSASTPILDGKPSGMMDTRLSYYALNQQNIPSITGWVIPELVLSRHAYETEILERMYRDISPHDPEKYLQHEWLNSRGAIARFDRHAIEIRILDIQETPSADLGLIALIISVLKALTTERWVPFNHIAAWSEESLHAIWQQVILSGQSAIVTDKTYLMALGIDASSMTVKDIWQHLYTQVFQIYDTYDTPLTQAIEHILTHGNLSERILHALRRDYRKEALRDVYQRLAMCLKQGALF